MAVNPELSIHALERALNQLVAAQNGLADYLPKEALDPLDEIWDDGNAILAKVVAYGMSIEEAVKT